MPGDAVSSIYLCRFLQHPILSVGILPWAKICSSKSCCCTPRIQKVPKVRNHIWAQQHIRILGAFVGTTLTTHRIVVPIHSH
jgi:hypothetical protein